MESAALGPELNLHEVEWGGSRAPQRFHEVSSGEPFDSVVYRKRVQTCGADKLLACIPLATRASIGCAAVGADQGLQDPLNRLLNAYVLLFVLPGFRMLSRPERRDDIRRWRRLLEIGSDSLDEVVDFTSLARLLHQRLDVRRREPLPDRGIPRHSACLRELSELDDEVEELALLLCVLLWRASGLQVLEIHVLPGEYEEIRIVGPVIDPGAQDSAQGPRHVASAGRCDEALECKPVLLIGRISPRREVKGLEPGEIGQRDSLDLRTQKAPRYRVPPFGPHHLTDDQLEDGLLGAREHAEDLAPH